MTENLNKNLDNGSLIRENIVENEQNNGDFLEKEQNNTKIHVDMCKNEGYFDKVNSKFHIDSVTTPDPVSEIEHQTSVENTSESILQISEKDDEMLFSRLFPGVKRENIENDRLFKLFARGKSKESSFTAIYSDFLSFINEISEDMRIKAFYSEKSKQSAVGALSSSESHNDGFFTKEQVLRMSRDQIAENYEKIRKSQAHW